MPPALPGRTGQRAVVESDQPATIGGDERLRRRFPVAGGHEDQVAPRDSDPAQDNTPGRQTPDRHRHRDERPGRPRHRSRRSRRQRLLRGPGGQADLLSGPGRARTGRSIHAVGHLRSPGRTTYVSGLPRTEALAARPDRPNTARPHARALQAGAAPRTAPIPSTTRGSFSPSSIATARPATAIAAPST